MAKFKIGDKVRVTAGAGIITQHEGETGLVVFLYTNGAGHVGGPVTESASGRGPELAPVYLVQLENQAQLNWFIESYLTKA